MTAISETLRNLVQVLERLHVDYMLIGGHALPMYGRPRSTIDIDIAIAMKLLQPMQLEAELENAGFQVSSFSEETAYFVVTDTRAFVEVEVWLRPDGITIDAECLSRRKKVKIEDFDFWIIGPEDFIVNKLSRRDRRVQDEVDVLSVLKNTRLKLDIPYLHKIAERAGILVLLRAFEKKTRVSD